MRKQRHASDEPSDAKMPDRQQSMKFTGRFCCLIVNAVVHRCSCDKPRIYRSRLRNRCFTRAEPLFSYFKRHKRGCGGAVGNTKRVFAVLQLVHGENALIVALVIGNFVDVCIIHRHRDRPSVKVKVVHIF